MPSLRTDRLLLRPYSLADAPRVQEFAGAREVASTTLNVPHPYEDGMAEAWIEGHASDWDAGRRLPLAITGEGEGLVGGIGLNLSLGHRRAEVGYWVAVPFWGRGYATEAARALLGFGFQDLGLHRIVAHHLSRNPASGSVLRKLGMKHEGTLRQHIVKWDQLEDLEMYGVLKAEWEELDA